MIPKIIHLCWLSGDKFPSDIQTCIDTWHEKLPDYKIMVWDKKRFDINSIPWVKEAYEAKKYAFAADYIRLYALYNYGGIYLDSDVIVYKSFNNLLHLPYFIGEDQCNGFEPAIIGSEKRNIWIKHLLDRYNGRHFIGESGNLDMLTLPVVFYQVLSRYYKFRRFNNRKKEEYVEKDSIYVFSKKHFNSRNHIGVKKTKYSYCSHAYKGSWMEKNNNIKNKIKNLLPRWILNLCLSLTAFINYKKHHQYAIPYEK